MARRGLVHLLPKTVQKIRSWLAAVPRLLFASYYFFIGGIQQLVESLGSASSAPTESAFEQALVDTHYMIPLLSVGCICSGALLFFRRTVPLGVVLVTPIVIIIFLYHLFITRAWIWGTLNVLFLGVVGWQFRHGFTCLWNYRTPATTPLAERPQQ